MPLKHGVGEGGSPGVLSKYSPTSWAPSESSDVVATIDYDAIQVGQFLTIPALANDLGTGLTIISVSVRDDVGGSATIDGDDIVFDPESDFDYLLPGQNFVVTLDYVIQDEHGHQASGTILVTVERVLTVWITEAEEILLTEAGEAMCME